MRQHLLACAASELNPGTIPGFSSDAAQANIYTHVTFELEPGVVG